MRMSLVQYVKPFLELGICKEYSMARKTTGSAVTTRSKKAGSPTKPAAAQAAEIPVSVPVSKTGKPLERVSAKSVNLEEQIRVRAYELYLERRATAGSGSGDENQDWLIAEREVRSRLDGQGHHTA
jgi:hypothetical protein